MSVQPDSQALMRDWREARRHGHERQHHGEGHETDEQVPRSGAADEQRAEHQDEHDHRGALVAADEDETDRPERGDPDRDEDLFPVVKLVALDVHDRPDAEHEREA
ncbi:hypothetical protein P9139_12410 [Curtobacterium flaccumfaciens]|nr:hypothetical protein P9139_12410 [Curtobacterium flaccumfaciens]